MDGTIGCIQLNQKHILVQNLVVQVRWWFVYRCNIGSDGGGNITGEGISMKFCL